MRRIVLTLILGVCLLTTACNKSIVEKNQKGDEVISAKDVEGSKEEKLLEKDSMKEKVINEVNFSESFQDINGCAYFYDENDNRYDIYNSKLTKEQISPYSSFKIISTLMGLDAGVIQSKQSTMGYNGENYWNEDWNKNLNLEEAFKTSCVWYFEKVVDGLSKDYVQKILESLEYGNNDLSTWTATGHNDFWLDASLKISPEEQIEVLVKIFNYKTSFSKEHINLLKEIMLVKSDQEYKIYGKTGSAKVENGWFVGFFEKNDRKVYFAVRLDEEFLELPGPKAKEITFDIIKQYY
ncbi:beta-lactamase class D [Mobilisporobacter senegalensis]|uniref:beta-lactamase n=1 Tax=Mobilisporobacter senegalensis TaxID=1329262 RepID=A0A3N1XB04_9FIRM|nr:class D beta-lactamase [Mobilisporobacter senegalensis]ROR23923.1 beta-lactamase class D [Mobilisporobacter senegalensis]